jgi:hypothetical protein
MNDEPWTGKSMEWTYPSLLEMTSQYLIGGTQENYENPR